jgi:hypothetical protein
LTTTDISDVVVMDTLMERLGRHRDGQACVPDSEILTIAVVAARYVVRHHERAAPLQIDGRRCWRDRIGVVRVNRRLYQRANGMVWIPEVLGKAGATGDGFIIASLPAPALVRRRARAWRCRKVPGVNAAGSALPNWRHSLDGACIWSATCIKR